MKKKSQLFAILHNVRSLHNVGSVFRTAEAAGVAKIYLTGYTPSPLDEMGRMRKEIAKTALGAENLVPWEKVVSLPNLLKRLKKERIYIVGLENALGAIDYRKYKAHFPCALILGNEVRGLSPAILKKTDAVISIPMRGRKESLNVSVAFGVAVYKIFE